MCFNCCRPIQSPLRVLSRHPNPHGTDPKRPNPTQNDPNPPPSQTNNRKRLGTRQIADAHTSALVAAVRKHAPRSRRIHLFGRLLGLVGPPLASPAAAGVVVQYWAVLQAECGPLLHTEATEGGSRLLSRTAAELAAPLLQPTLAAPVPEVSNLAAAVHGAAAGGSDEAQVDVDEVCALLVAAWEAQRAADAQQLQAVMRGSAEPRSTATAAGQQPGGVMCQDDLLQLLEQVREKGWRAAHFPHLKEKEELEKQAHFREI